VNEAGDLGLVIGDSASRRSLGDEFRHPERNTHVSPVIPSAARDPPTQITGTENCPGRARPAQMKREWFAVI